MRALLMVLSITIDIFGLLSSRRSPVDLLGRERQTDGVCPVIHGRFISVRLTSIRGMFALNSADDNVANCSID